jgi:hypothetical protein
MYLTTSRQNLCLEPDIRRVFSSPFSTPGSPSFSLLEFQLPDLGLRPGLHISSDNKKRKHLIAELTETVHKIVQDIFNVHTVPTLNTANRHKGNIYSISSIGIGKTILRNYEAQQNQQQIYIAQPATWTAWTVTDTVYTAKPVTWTAWTVTDIHNSASYMNSLNSYRYTQLSQLHEQPEQLQVYIAQLAPWTG